MRLTSVFFYKVHNIPYRYRGKHGKIKKPTIKDIVEYKKDLEREEKNMLLLRHPYLTKEQSANHMKESKEGKFQALMHKWLDERNAKFNKTITIADRLNHLKIHEAWD